LYFESDLLARLLLQFCDFSIFTPGKVTRFPSIVDLSLFVAPSEKQVQFDYSPLLLPHLQQMIAIFFIGIGLSSLFALSSFGRSLAFYAGPG